MHEPEGGTPLDVWMRAPYSSHPQAHPLSCQWPPFPLPLPGEAGSVLSQPQVFLKAAPSPSTTPVHRCRLPQQFSSGTWLAGSMPMGAVVASVLALRLDPSVGLPRPSIGPFSRPAKAFAGSSLLVLLSSPLTPRVFWESHGLNLSHQPSLRPPFFSIFLFILYIHTHTHTFHILIIQIYFQCRKTRRYR